MNVVNIMGNVGGDPEIKNTESTTIANFSIATKNYKGETTWHNCVAFGKTADVIGQHVAKGDLIGVSGSYESEEYEEKRYYKVKVQNFYFGSKKNRVDNSTSSRKAESQPVDEGDDLPF
jgi:single-strand DNA-binding protein